MCVRACVCVFVCLVHVPCLYVSLSLVRTIVDSVEIVELKAFLPEVQIEGKRTMAVHNMLAI